MRSIQISSSWADGPQEVTVDKPSAPSETQIQVRMQAFGLHNVVRSRASGKHYSASTLPHTLGMDGVGVDEATGQLYYVAGMATNFGTFAEYVNVDKRAAVPLPSGVDAAAIAASVNPAASSWLALTTRTLSLPQNFTVVIIGATSASGELAVPLSKALGAGKVIGVARNANALASIAGLDRSITLCDPVTDTDFSGLDDVDVVLDYVGGDPAVQLLNSLSTGLRPVQYVQIGGLAGQATLDLPTALLRAKNLTLRGSGPGAWAPSEMARQLPQLVKTLAGIPLKQPQKFPLDKFAEVWADQDLPKKGRIVFTLP